MMFRIIIGPVVLLALVASSAARPELEVEWFLNGDNGWFEESEDGVGYEPDESESEEEDPTLIPPGTLDILGKPVDLSRVSGVSLRVPNGGTWGKWGDASFCPDDSYAAGYNMKIEPKQGGGDDTSLNAIKIICKDKSGNVVGEAVSKQGPWGNWVGESSCSHHSGIGTDVMTSFALQVESPQGALKDDTAANYVKFKCGGLTQSNSQEYVLVKPPGHGYWGNWGAWSPSCPAGQAICGLRTRVEDKQYVWDDTALNDAIFYCCK